MYQIMFDSAVLIMNFKDTECKSILVSVFNLINH